ncbi:hypothetical protein MTBPR1_80193 [Candidatus Terasakiella magnetica]|uniref:CagE TrbE VirB component of type IV transporter system central domain-containing protein n=1 Tax=Candidatus Terasakiella magnetica TaxID=1867952 RepID=A0A1C3RLW0_9PROT|nr:hypothetical protein [Candidatus Terasakiella magnetica]SCA58139.1 hypothetical protein MTBPR1_80193 [Candidatus Terasakiella magnetica]
MELSHLIDFAAVFVVVWALVTIMVKAQRKKYYFELDESELSELLNLDRTEGDDDSICVDRDGTCTKVVELMGQDFAALSPEDRYRKLYSREAWVQSLAELGVDFKIVSHKTENKPIPLNRQARRHLARADETWESQFERTYDLRHFISFTVKTIEDYKLLNDAVEETISHLSDYKPRLLAKVSETENELLSHLSDLANPLWPSPVGNAKTDIGKHITGSRFKVRPDGVMEFIRGPEKIYGASIGFWRWNNDQDDEMFSSVLAQDVPMTIVHLVETKNSADSRSEVNNRDLTLEMDDSVENQMVTAKDWTTPGNDEEHNVCYHHVSILVYAEDEETLSKRIRQATSPLSRYGVRPAVDGPVSAAAFLSLFPGTAHRFRNQFMFSHNIAAMSALEGKSQGLERSMFGYGPVQRFKPVDGSGTVNFQFCNSEDPKAVGHTTLIGKTGGGKTTILTFLIKGLLRFRRVRILAFDRRKGMYVFTKFAGGTYLSLESKQGFNPLQQELTAANRQNIRHWLRMLAGGLSDPETDQVLGRIMRALPNIPREHRSLKTLWDTHLKGTEYGRRIHKFVHDPDFDWIFNAEECLLQSMLRKNRLVVIDTLEFLDNEEIAPPFLLYALSAVEEINSADGVPFAFVCDETAGAAKNKEFLKRLFEIIFEWRKIGGIGVFAFQTDETIRELKLEGTIKDQMATLLFWRNRKFNEESAARWGMEVPEYQFLTYETGKAAGDYALLYKQDEVSASIQADLSILGRDRFMFNSDVNAANALIALENDPKVKDPKQAYLELEGNYDDFVQAA